MPLETSPIRDRQERLKRSAFPLRGAAQYDCRPARMQYQAPHPKPPPLHCPNRPARMFLNRRRKPSSLRGAVSSIVLWLILGARLASADDIGTDGLTLPVKCVLGETCWLANLVDVDPTQGARDFRCQPRTYDSHDGVDVAIRDLGVMREGVPVVASASGIVRNVRSGMEDRPVTDAAARARVRSRECGNGVVIQHENGWETQYCHLQQGSVRVKAGDRIARGAQIGLVGLSGATEFPHVHFTVRHNGVVIDPFTGKASSAGCGLASRPLWGADPPVTYEEVALYNAGFAGGQPDIERIRGGEEDAPPVAASSSALVLWVDILGVQAGDKVRITITGPTGRRVFEQEQTMERTQARRFVFAGRRRPAAHWPAGTYSGEAVLIRRSDGQPLQRSIARTVTIEP